MTKYNSSIVILMYFMKYYILFKYVIVLSNSKDII